MTKNKTKRVRDRERATASVKERQAHLNGIHGASLLSKKSEAKISDSRLDAEKSQLEAQTWLGRPEYVESHPILPAYHRCLLLLLITLLSARTQSCFDDCGFLCFLVLF